MSEYLNVKYIGDESREFVDTHFRMTIDDAEIDRSACTDRVQFLIWLINRAYGTQLMLNSDNTFVDYSKLDIKQRFSLRASLLGLWSGGRRHTPVPQTHPEIMKYMLEILNLEKDVYEVKHDPSHHVLLPAFVEDPQCPPRGIVISWNTTLVLKLQTNELRKITRTKNYYERTLLSLNEYFPSP
jgi:hypothetical protein